MAATKNLVEQAIPLVEFVAGAANNTHNVGHQTSTIYDTAWVSMVRKPNDNAWTLLFPECFQYVLERQLPSGGWESYDSTIDGIVNTLGGLLALKKNSNLAVSGISKEEIDLRVEDAIGFLREKLHVWDVASANHVGFEIVIPAMLELLSQECIHFEFPGRPLLMELNRKKLGKIPPSVWSKTMQTTLSHSLEAFVGKVDFDSLRHLLVYGAMGSSPAATAAYLLYSSTWDEEAEGYLRNLVTLRKRDDGFGGVPTMYPSTGFEVLWVASTLLEYGFDARTLSGLNSIVDITDEYFNSQNGLASGFSKLSVPDADDTAKSILVRSLLGKPTNPDKLIERFEGSTHFLTYGMERHPSLTTNCNILSAILESPDPTKYISQIEKCARFLVAAWSSPDIPFTDKWNISEFYPIMLMSESLIRLLKFWDDGVVKALPDDLILDKIPLVLFQALLQTLQKQNANGSWAPKPSREITAYAIISLVNLGSLPFLAELSTQIQTAIEKGRSYIEITEEDLRIEYVWIAKTTYSPVNVSKAYILSALKTKYPKYILSLLLTRQVDIPRNGLSQYMRIFSKLPRLNEFPLWRIQGCIMEGYLYLRQLKSVRLDMFARANMKKDEYFDFIAMTFACANNLQSSFLRTNIMFDMMTLVLRIYQVDEYVEHIIGKEFRHSLKKVKKTVDNVFQNDVYSKKGSNVHAKSHVNGHTNGYSNGDTNHFDNPSTTNGDETPLDDASIQEEDLSEIHNKLSAFILSITCHPSISTASEYDRNLLTQEMHKCLLSHIIQIEDSEQYLSQNGTRRAIPRGSFHNWVSTTAASHSCAPLSLTFLQCLLRHPGHGARTAEEQYLVQDLWKHLSNKCRMENDRASLRRDRNENNLNSLDFPEFECHEGGKDAVERQKEQLSAIVRYERKCCDLALETLGRVRTEMAESQDLEAWRFYYFLSDIYNDVYAMKDISCEG